jgi:hypothetical protein
LTHRMQQIATDPALRLAQGQASAKRAATYQPELVVNEMEMAYCAVLANSGI